MLQWVDGFDAQDSPSYTNSNVGGGVNTIKYYGSLLTFAQVNMSPGRFGGQALHVINTAFGVANWTRVFGAQPQWAVGFAFALQDGLASNDPLFYCLQSGGPSKTVVVRTTTRDGKSPICGHDESTSTSQ